MISHYDEKEMIDENPRRPASQRVYTTTCVKDSVPRRDLNPGRLTAVVKSKRLNKLDNPLMTKTKKNYF